MFIDNGSKIMWSVWNGKRWFLLFGWNGCQPYFTLAEEKLRLFKKKHYNDSLKKPNENIIRLKVYKLCKIMKIGFNQKYNKFIF